MVSTFPQNMTILFAVLAGGWIGLLVDIAIVCVIFWVIWALIQWWGVTVPRPVMIFLQAIAAIVLIILVAKLAMMLVGSV